MYVNVFEAACLIQLQTSTWQASKMLNEEEIAILADPNWVKGRKHLVDPEFLKPPRNRINRARKFLNDISLPFPVPGMLLIAKDTVGRADRFLANMKEGFMDDVRAIAVKYPEAREIARTYLEPKNLFNERDYPTDIIPLYSFGWRYLNISVPMKLQEIAPDIYRRELAQFEAMMNEAKELAVAALYEEISELVGKMVERLGSEDDGKPRKFRDSLVENFTEFFETFEERNIFENDKLTEIVGRAKDVLKGVKADELRKYPDFRQNVREQMQAVKQTIEEACVDLPRRKFKLDDMSIERQAA